MSRTSAALVEAALNHGARHCMLAWMVVRAPGCVLGYVLGALVAACGSPPRSPMYPPGSDKDDGYGDLARMSARLRIGDGSDAPFAAHRSRRAQLEDEPYGGDAYGGDAYGQGAPGYPPGSPPATVPVPRYTPASGLAGTIEGRVTWHGAPPPGQLTTVCGPLDAPGIRVAADRSVAGVLVFIEHVEVGRTLPAIGRAATVGGIIAKRGCALGPTLQILTPLPADLAIHADATDTKLRVTLPGGAQPVELQPGARIVLPAQPGITRVEAADDSLAPAWVVAATTPYYALTDEHGRYRLDELAAGTYDITFWQPPIATAVNGRLVFGAPTVVHRSIKVDPARPAHLDLALP